MLQNFFVSALLPNQSLHIRLLLCEVFVHYHQFEYSLAKAYTEQFHQISVCVQFIKKSRAAPLYTGHVPHSLHLLCTLNLTVYLNCRKLLTFPPLSLLLLLLLLLCLRFHCISPTSIQPQASAGDFSAFCSSLLYALTLYARGVIRSEPGCQTHETYVLICCLDKHFCTSCRAEIGFSSAVIVVNRSANAALDQSVLIVFIIMYFADVLLRQKKYWPFSVT